MLGDKDLLEVPFREQTSFLAQIEETKYLDLMEHKEAEIKGLKRKIKNLQKQIRHKNQAQQLLQTSDGKNSYFRIMIQREVSRYNQLIKTVCTLTKRIKKLTSDIDHQVSISQNSQTMQDFVLMLDDVNLSIQKNSLEDDSFEGKNEALQETDRALDQLEIAMRRVLLKWGQTNKNYKQVVQTQKQQLQEFEHCKQLLKKEKKNGYLLQKLLQKNQIEKNQLVNQIDLCIDQRDLDDLKSKSKQEIIMFACKLNYRIKDLEQQKQTYMKDFSKEMHKETKLYQQLVEQVKNFKQKAKIKHSSI